MWFFDGLIAGAKGVIDGSVGASGSATASDVDAVVVRPHFPAITICSLVLWLACAVAYERSSVLDQGQCSILFAMSVLFTVLGLIASMRWRWCFAAAGFCLGLACGFAGAANLHADARLVSEADSSVLVRFRAEEDARAGSYGKRCIAVALSGSYEGCRLLLNLEDGDAVSYGDVVYARVRCTPLEAGESSYLWQQGLAGTAKISEVEKIPASFPFSVLQSIRQEAVASFAQAIPDALVSLTWPTPEALASFTQPGSDAGALLSALVCNERTQLDEGDVYDDFRVTGLAHIVAVSGSHLVLVASFVAAFTRALSFPRVVSIGIQLGVVFLYLLFTAAPVSGIRAALMSLLCLCSFVFRRRGSSLNALGICIALMISCSPQVSVSASFALSVGSSLGIVLLSGLFAAWLRKMRHVPRFVTEVLSATLAASIATMPYSAALFGQVPLVSPLANILAGPLFGVVCGLGVASALLSAVVVAVPVLSLVHEMVLFGALATSQMLIEIVGLCASLPYACVPVSVNVPFAVVASSAMMLALWHGWRHTRGTLSATAAGPTAVRATAVRAVTVVLSVALAVHLAFPRSYVSEIIMLDVGQGDAFVVRSGSATVLVDTGRQDTMLLQALARHGVYRLDAVIVTHSDEDHCGSLNALRGVVRTGMVLVASDALTCPCKGCEGLLLAAGKLVDPEGIVPVSQGQVIQVGSLVLRVLWPKDYRDEGDNDDSLVLLVCEDVDGDGSADFQALLTGDAEDEVLAKVVSGYELRDIDVLKVGHHGSKNAVSNETLSVLTPDVAFVSVGEDNRYGHPAEETLASLEVADVRVFRTDEQGDVSCKITAEGLVFKTQR